MKTLTADRRMIKIAMDAPYLERDEEHALAEAWRNDNDQEARTRETPVIAESVETGVRAFCRSALISA